MLIAALVRAGDFLRRYFADHLPRQLVVLLVGRFLSQCARVFSPVIDKRHVYGDDGLQEIDVDFDAGNHPH